MAKTYTYNHRLCKINVNGIDLTDFNGDPTIEPGGDDWATTVGLNGVVQRSLLDNHLYTVTLPMVRTSPQVDALAALSVADKKLGAGPYTFAFKDLNGTDIVLGECWIQNMKSRGSLGAEASARNVVLAVVSHIEFEGA